MKNKVILKNVILAFESIFVPVTNKNKPESEPRYEASFILNNEKHADLIASVKLKLEEIKLENKVKNIDGKSLCLRSGDEFESEWLMGNHIIKASSKHKFQILQRDLRTPISQEEDLIGNGCVVNAVIVLNYYNFAENGVPVKGINAYLSGIQLVDNTNKYSPSGIEDDLEPLEPINDSNEENIFG